MTPISRESRAGSTGSAIARYRHRVDLIVDQSPVGAPLAAAAVLALLAIGLAVRGIPRRVWLPFRPQWFQTASLAHAEVVKTWTLGLGAGSTADLLLGTEGRAARVVIQQGGGDEPWRVQLNHSNHDVEADLPYVLRFRARADAPRELSVGLAENHVPWDVYGFGTKITLTPEWQSFAFEFSVSEGDARTRVYFNVGGSPTPVEAADLTLLPVGGEQPR
jgi:Carbohydrate binding domain